MAPKKTILAGDTHNTQEVIASDLEWLRRLSIMTRNRDVLLRHHGFLLVKDGWRVAEAFDMKPSLDKRKYALTIDGLVADPDIELTVITAGYYGIDDGRANEIVDRIRVLVSTWNEGARKLGIAAGEVELIQIAFSAMDD